MKKLQLSYITLALAAACGFSQVSFAAVDPSAAGNTVLPIAGASAADGLIRFTILSDLCVAGSQTLVNGGTGNEWAVACTTKTVLNGVGGAAGVPVGTDVVVLKHSRGGSAVGVSNLIAASGATQVNLPTCNVAAANVTVSGVSYPNVTCSGATVTLPIDVGVSDVDPPMFKGINVPTGGSAVTAAGLASITYKTVVANGFGVVLSTNFRNALQTQQGLTSGSDAIADMPSLSHMQVAAMLNRVPGTLASLFPGIALPTDTSLKVCRRVKGSGTQATSNVQFFNIPCAADSASPATSGPNVFEGSGSGDAEACFEAWNTPVSKTIATDNAAGTVTVNGTAKTGYAIGVMGLERSNKAYYRFIKVDGVAPTLKNMHDGSYPIFEDQTMQYRNAGGSRLYDFFVNNLSNPVNVKEINTGLKPGSSSIPGYEGAYLAVGIRAGNVADQIWSENNPVIGWMHSSTNTKPDNACLLFPIWNPGQANFPKP